MNLQQRHELYYYFNNSSCIGFLTEAETYNELCIRLIRQFNSPRMKTPSWRRSLHCNIDERLNSADLLCTNADNATHLLNAVNTNGLITKQISNYHTLCLNSTHKLIENGRNESRKWILLMHKLWLLKSHGCNAAKTVELRRKNQFEMWTQP